MNVTGQPKTDFRTFLSYRIQGILGEKKITACDVYFSAKVLQDFFSWPSYIDMGKAEKNLFDLKKSWNPRIWALSMWKALFFGGGAHFGGAPGDAGAGWADGALFIPASHGATGCLEKLPSASSGASGGWRSRDCCSCFGGLRATYYSILDITLPGGCLT